MSLTESAAVRTDDSSGLNIKTFVDAGSAHNQGVALVDEDGDHLQLESWHDSSALVEKESIKGSAGRLFYLKVHSTSASAAYIQLFDETGTTPSTTPLHRTLVPAGAEVTIDLRLFGRKFSTGILVAMSSTMLTYTAHGSNEFAFVAGYK